MRTQVLSKPAPAAVKSTPPPPVARPQAIRPAPVAPSVSSTAKTADLKGKLKPVSSYPAPARPAPPRPPAAPSARPPVRKPEPQIKAVPRPAASNPAGASARNGAAPGPVTPVAVAKAPAATLVCKSEALRFAVPGVRAIIGRHLGAEDNIDIDLGVLKVGADRVSRRHAEIIKRGEDYYIRDLGSRNGTFIAGQGRLGRDQLYKLEDRSQVVIGGATLEFRRG
jgi:hypothetical protein